MTLYDLELISHLAIEELTTWTMDTGYIAVQVVIAVANSEGCIFAEGIIYAEDEVHIVDSCIARLHIKRYEGIDRT